MGLCGNGPNGGVRGVRVALEIWVMESRERREREFGRREGGRGGVWMKQFSWLTVEKGEEKSLAVGGLLGSTTSVLREPLRPARFWTRVKCFFFFIIKLKCYLLVL